MFIIRAKQVIIKQVEVTAEEKKVRRDEKAARKSATAQNHLRERCLVCLSPSCDGLSFPCFSGCYKCGNKNHDYNGCCVSLYYLTSGGYCQYCLQFGPKHENYKDCPMKSRIRRLMISSFVEPDNPNERTGQFIAHVKKQLRDPASYNKFLYSASMKAASSLKNIPR